MARRPKNPISRAVARDRWSVWPSLSRWRAWPGGLDFASTSRSRRRPQRSQFLQVARQGALNLTTIDWQHADADVHRILDGATGEFYDDFAKRSQPFIEVVKQAKADHGRHDHRGWVGVGDGRHGAQVLVAVSVQTSNAGEAEQDPQEWRMRIAVQKVGDQVESFQCRSSCHEVADVAPRRRPRCWRLGG